jgi:hypothetical protein
MRASSSQSDGSQISALAELGIHYAKTVVMKSCLRTPVDGVANQALAVLLHWNEPDVIESLEKLIDLRYSQAFSLRSLVRTLVPRSRMDNERLPREYQIVRAILGLMQRTRPELLKTALRKKITAILETSDGANSGEAALLLYILSQEQGLNRLRASLSGQIPAAHKDAAAACVLIGTAESKQILLEALNNPNLTIQHTAAFALKQFPSTDAREQAVKWRARFDGIDSPPGEEVAIAGKTIKTYSMEEVMHSNMDAFFTLSLDHLRKEYGSILTPHS